MHIDELREEFLTSCRYKTKLILLTWIHIDELREEFLTSCCYKTGAQCVELCHLAKTCTFSCAGE